MHSSPKKQQLAFKHYKNVLHRIQLELHTHQNQQVYHLDLHQFKTQQCQLNSKHNHKNCPDFHNQKDRKRKGNSFSSEMCTNLQKNKSCLKGDKCKFSHNYVEMLYRETKYRTRFCDKYADDSKICEYGIYCSFAHSVKELLVPLIHTLDKNQKFYMFYFKTVFCPFNLFEHDRSRCEYYHNWQDYRRKPRLDRWEVKECKNWEGSRFLMNYEDGCVDGFECQFMHGWKEIYYHPLFYKTEMCQEYYSKGYCGKYGICHLYHDLNEKRQPNLIKDPLSWIDQITPTPVYSLKYHSNIQHSLKNQQTKLSYKKQIKRKKQKQKQKQKYKQKQKQEVPNMDVNQDKEMDKCWNEDVCSDSTRNMTNSYLMCYEKVSLEYELSEERIEVDRVGWDICLEIED